MCSLNEIAKIGIYIQKELQNWFQKIVFCFRCGHIFLFLLRNCFINPVCPIYKYYKVQVLFILL